MPETTPLKLPDDFLGTVTALLNRPPSEKKPKLPAKRQAVKKGGKKR